MAPKNEQLQRMIAKSNSLVAKMQSAIDSGELDEAEQAEALQTISDMTDKIERLTAKVKP